MRQAKNSNNSRKLGVVLGVGIIICMMSIPGWGQYGGGSGTEGDPFLISDPNHMQAIGEHEEHWVAGTYFKLTEDIDLSRYTGTQFNIIGYYINSWSYKKSFSGVFDGNNRKIFNFTYSTTSAKNGVGLFGYLGNGGQIKDLGLDDPNIETTGDYVGGLVGYIDYGTISNCYATGTVSGNGYLGGLVGWNDYGTISNCYATGAVTSDKGKYSEFIGGLVGMNWLGDISNCYATGAVSNGSYLGGLVGWNYYKPIRNCYATGAVSGGSYLGGLVGWNSDTISNCYATGAVTGSDNSRYLGGLVGSNNYAYSKGAISNCYATGAITGGDNSDHLGGLVGINSGTTSDCYWDEESSGLSYSHGGRKKTTAQMKESQTYKGWNDGSWVIDNGNDKPHLWWEDGASGLPAITTDYPARTYPGNGEDQPFELDSSEDLLCLSQRTIDWEKNFILTSDIDMNLITDYFPPTDFNGHIDGTGYSVINLTVDAHVIGNNCQLGLIGRLGNQGHIENLGVEEPNIIGGDYSYHLGGLVGLNWLGAISNCYATGVVSGNGYLGGLVGWNYKGTISNCYATGAVTGSDDSWSLGGLVGYNTGDISNCYATGAVSGDHVLGGLVGYNLSGDISNCYTTRSVTGGDRLGGLVGWNRSGIISNCYTTGAVSGDVDLGGLVGEDSSGSYTKSFWDETVNAGLSGIGNISDPNVIAESADNMKKAGTFTSVGWDFLGESDNGELDYWRMCKDGGEYPKLSWQFLDGDLLCPDMVGFLDLFYFVSHWLDIDCDDTNNYCYRADINFSGRVDLVDFRLLADNWLIDFSLVSHWTMNERSGSTAKDSAGGHTGSLINFPTDDLQWVTGKVNGALLFDGLDDYVEAVGYKGVVGKQSRTVAAWIRTMATGKILSWGTGGDGQKWTFMLGGSGAIRVSVGNGKIVGSTVVNNGSWHHVAAVLVDDGTPNASEIKLYVDGIPETGTTTTPRAIITGSGASVKIGSDIMGVSGYFNSRLDDIRIYDRALSAKEIVTLSVK